MKNIIYILLFIGICSCSTTYNNYFISIEKNTKVEDRVNDSVNDFNSEINNIKTLGSNPFKKLFDEAEKSFDSIYRKRLIEIYY